MSKELHKIIKGKKPIFMGILNISEDSFSDGGKYLNFNAAIKKAKEIIKEGADIIDIGAESTGPNAIKITADQELTRMIPVLKEIRKFSDIPISIDTNKSEVAKETLNFGADIINDITALRGDKKITSVLKKSSCPIIIMYSKDSNAKTSLKAKNYSDITKTIITFFEKRISLCAKAGIKPDRIILDPGMGHFLSSIPRYSLKVISELQIIEKQFEQPILLGISRKSFLGGDLKTRDETAKPLTALAYLNGARIIRTHNVSGLKEYFKFAGIN